jgi:hypothetical protein
MKSPAHDENRTAACRTGHEAIFSKGAATPHSVELMNVAEGLSAITEVDGQLGAGTDFDIALRAL